MNNTPRRWVILEHVPPGEQPHWDVMLTVPDSETLATWRVDVPTDSDNFSLPATPLPAHRIAYLDWTGTTPPGDPRGEITFVDTGVFIGCETLAVLCRSENTGTLFFLQIEQTRMTKTTIASNAASDASLRVVLEQRRNASESDITFTQFATHIFPPLYDLPRDDARWETLRELAAVPLVLLTWLSRRATLALLHVAGFSDEQIAAVTILSLAGATRDELSALSLPAPHTPVDLTLPAPTPRWYPLVDEAACIGCLECVNFCLFGVYDVGRHNKPLVIKPDSCRDGCPACARVCPGAAIIFAMHDEPLIAGCLDVTSARTAYQAAAKTSEDKTPSDQSLDRLVAATDDMLV